MIREKNVELVEHNGAQFEHNRENSGALLQSIIGNFKSIIGTSLSEPIMQ